MVCKNCGASTVGNGGFCEYCGSELVFDTHANSTKTLGDLEAQTRSLLSAIRKLEPKGKQFEGTTLLSDYTHVVNELNHILAQIKLCNEYSRYHEDPERIAQFLVKATRVVNRDKMYASSYVERYNLTLQSIYLKKEKISENSKLIGDDLTREQINRNLEIAESYAGISFGLGMLIALISWTIVRFSAFTIAVIATLMVGIPAILLIVGKSRQLRDLASCALSDNQRNEIRSKVLKLQAQQVQNLTSYLRYKSSYYNKDLVDF